MRGGIRHGRGVQPLLANLIQRREYAIGAYLQAMFFLRAPFDSGDQHCRRETRVLQNSLANQRCDLAWRQSLREALPHYAPRFREFSLFVPAAQAVEFVAPDFHVHALHRNKVWQGSDFILRRKNDVRVSDWVRKTEFLQLRETLLHPEFSGAINSGIGNGLIETAFR